VGHVFRYVDDASLETHRHCDLPCPLCENTAEVHPFYAEPEGGYIDIAFVILCSSVAHSHSTPFRTSSQMCSPVITGIQVERVITW
jgi:hypothetical protein